MVTVDQVGEEAEEVGQVGGDLRLQESALEAATLVTVVASGEVVVVNGRTSRPT